MLPCPVRLRCVLLLLVSFGCLGLQTSRGSEPSLKEIYRKTLDGSAWVVVQHDNDQTTTGTGWIFDKAQRDLALIEVDSLPDRAVELQLAAEAP